jgi:uncharacterized membrane protein
MVHTTPATIHRVTVTSDVNKVVEGHVNGAAYDPKPETMMGDGPVYNVVEVRLVVW